MTDSEFLVSSAQPQKEFGAPGSRRAGYFLFSAVGVENLSTHFDRRIRVGGFVPCRGGIGYFYQRPSACQLDERRPAPAAIHFDDVVGG